MVQSFCLLLYSIAFVFWYIYRWFGMTTISWLLQISLLLTKNDSSFLLLEISLYLMTFGKGPFLVRVSFLYQNNLLCSPYLQAIWKQDEKHILLCLLWLHNEMPQWVFLGWAFASFRRNFEKDGDTPLGQDSNPVWCMPKWYKSCLTLCTSAGLFGFFIFYIVICLSNQEVNCILVNSILPTRISTKVHLMHSFIFIESEQKWCASCESIKDTCCSFL